MRPRKRILFVDDDRYEMLGFVERLEDEDFVVQCCTNAEEATNLLATKTFAPDVIITDLLMPSGAEASPGDWRRVGIEFCRVVREQYLLRCPLIVLTVVSTGHEEIRRYANQVLVKPVTPRQLLDRINEALR